MAYQENLLPKYHAEQHEVFIITSDYAFDATGKEIKKEKKEYLNEYGIPVKVLDRSRRFGPYSRYNDYQNLYATLQDLRPDIVFCHGGQFVALIDVIRYCQKNPKVKLYIDQHGDYYNTPVNTVRRRLAQRWIYGYWMRKAVKYTEKFWGVTPWRCEYLNDVYGIPKEKIGFLPMGGDDEKIHFECQAEIRDKIRTENQIAPEDLLIVTGGKIDSEKRIDVLMQAVAELDLKNLKLLIFGQPNDQMKERIGQLALDFHIRYVGWIPSDEAYNYFLAADIAFFPGTHSVLWEQACACGVPGVFRYWEGMRHVDVGGNALFLCEDSIEEMKMVLSELYVQPEKLAKMRSVARSKAIEVFSYRTIAQKSISKDT
jgi:glycosyltransferase involved in cell wall biosynthesis